MLRKRPTWIMSAIALALASPRLACAAVQPTPRPALVGAKSSFALSRMTSAAGPVTVLRPVGEARGLALFLSGDGGWINGLSEAMAQKGMIVARISTPRFLKALEAGKQRCLNPNYALLGLSEEIQHRFGQQRYMKPILVGYSSGATLAYGALVQAPAGSYRAAFSFGFAPDILGTKAWCKAPQLEASAVMRPTKGWLFAPARTVSEPWIVLQGAEDKAVSPVTARTFTTKVNGARYIELPKVGHGFAMMARWMPQFLSALDPLLAPAKVTVPARTADADVAGLPLTLVTDPAARHTDLMAVLYSGDGGWAGLDRQVSAQLAAQGVPVVGVDSLSYFWTARTPREAGTDLGRIISHFSRQWQRPRVLLLGYSFGADDLPYIVASLPPEMRPMIGRVSMLGLSASADFQFHLASWLDLSSDNALPTVPEIERLKGLPLQCIRGADESDSACPAIPAGFASQAILPGGHHFEGNAALIVQTMLHGMLG